MSEFNIFCVCFSLTDKKTEEKEAEARRRNLKKTLSALFFNYFVTIRFLQSAFVA